MDPNRQRQLELIAQAEMELEQERGAVKPPPYADNGDQIGPDYNRSIFGGQIGKSIEDLIPAAGHMIADTWDFAMPIDALTFSGTGGWYDTIANAGLDKTLRTTGPLAAGTAGAVSMGTLGATLGGPFAPLTGLIGAGIGFGLGSTAENVLIDAATGKGVRDQTGNPEDKSYTDYAKDLVYNSSLASLLGGAGKVTGAGIKRIPIENPFGQARADRAVHKKLGEMRPDYGLAIDQAYADAQAAGVPQSLLDKRSLGELLGDTAIKAEQRVLAGKDSAGLGQAEAARQARNDAQLKYLDQLEPSGPTPDLAQTDIQSRLASDTAALQAQTDTILKLDEGRVSGAETMRDYAVEQLPPEIDKAQAGNIARDAIAGEYSTFRGPTGRVSSYFNKTGEGAIDPAPITNVIENAAPNYFEHGGTGPSGDLIALINRLKPDPGPIIATENGKPVYGPNPKPFTMKNAVAERSAAGKIARGDDRPSAAVAVKIIEAIDSAVNDAIEAGSVTVEEAANWERGRAERKLQGDIYESRGLPTKGVLSKEPSGSYVVQPSEVPGRYLQQGPGGREAIQNYKVASGGDPAAMDALHRYTTDSFRSAAVDADGVVNPKRAAEWLKRHDEALKEMPQLRDKFSNAERAQRFLDEKTADLEKNRAAGNEAVKRSQADVENGALKMWFKDIEPEQAIHKMLSTGDPIAQTRATANYIKDPTAKAGLRRGIIDWYKKQVFEANAKVKLDEASLPGGATFDGRTRDAMVGKVWNNLKPVLEKSNLFTKSQIEGFDHLYKDKASQMSVDSAKMRGGSDTYSNTSIMAAIQDAGLRYVSSFPKTGILSKVLFPIIRKIPYAKFIARFEEALLNPRIARDIAQKATAKNVTKNIFALFPDEIKAATGSALSGYPITQEQARKERPKPTVPKQQSVTAKESFPAPEKLLKPPVNKSPLQKSSFDPVAHTKKFAEQRSPETAARVGVESTNNPFAVSPKGAAGPSQLMPETAMEIARDLGETYIPIRPGMTPEEQQVAIEQNIRFGDHYYNKQLEKYKSPTLAWAAYNAGPGALREAMAKAGSSTDESRIMRNLPKETRDYVNKLVARYGKG